MNTSSSLTTKSDRPARNDEFASSGHRYVWPNVVVISEKFAFGSLLIKRSCPAPNIGPKDPFHKIPLWFEVPLSGILIGPVPDEFTRVNKNESLPYLY